MYGEMIFPAQNGHGVGAFRHRHAQVELGNAHHGAAGEDLIGVLAVAYGFQQVIEAGANGDHQVHGVHDNIAGHGDDTPDQGLAQVHGIVNGLAGAGVEHGAAHCRRQSAGGDLAAGDGLNQLLLGALGILGRQGLYGDLRMGVNVLFQGGDGLLLVVLHGDVGFVQA